MKRLLTYGALVAGVGAASASAHDVILTGLAGLLAGAFSMAVGELTSVSSQSELVQAEIETFAIRGDGEVAWRVAHSDVVTAAELLGGRLVLSSFSGEVQAIDPATGRPAA